MILDSEWIDETSDFKIIIHYILFICEQLFDQNTF